MLLQVPRRLGLGLDCSASFRRVRVGEPRDVAEVAVWLAPSWCGWGSIVGRYSAGIAKTPMAKAITARRGNPTSLLVRSPDRGALAAVMVAMTHWIP